MRPSAIAALLAAAVTLSCKPKPTPEPTPAPAQTPAARGLVGTSWVLQDLGGAGVIDAARATLEFPEAGRVAGRGSCNRFFGSVEISDDRISFSQLGSTEMACIGAAMDQEIKYLKALQSAERYTLAERSLQIYVKGMDKPLGFRRAE
jgi:heat shock protein HslJ